jgi:hypothetical protein
MTIFELVKLALDELYSEAKQTYGSKVDEKIRKQIDYLVTCYGDLTTTRRKPVDYKDPATRFAYVFKYVAAHGDYLVQGLKMLRTQLGGNIFSGGNARVSCVGGGPGSDIIAVLKYLDEQKKTENVAKITCYLLDKEQAWADTWTELDASLKMKVQLNANFQALDVTDPASWKYQRKFLQADLFTLSYFVSEVYSLDWDGAGKITAFWQELFRSAKPAAMFIYTDNGSDPFNDYFHKQCEAAKLKQVLCRDNMWITPSYAEQKSELAEYSKKFDHNPKIQATMTLRVLRKG